MRQHRTLHQPPSETLYLQSNEQKNPSSQSTRPGGNRLASIPSRNTPGTVHDQLITNNRYAILQNESDAQTPQNINSDVDLEVSMNDNTSVIGTEPPDASPTPNKNNA